MQHLSSVWKGKEQQVRLIRCNYGVTHTITKVQQDASITQKGRADGSMSPPLGEAFCCQWRLCHLVQNSINTLTTARCEGLTAFERSSLMVLGFINNVYYYR